MCSGDIRMGSKDQTQNNGDNEPRSTHLSPQTTSTTTATATTTTTITNTLRT
jgi:hypothetical protein